MIHHKMWFQNSRQHFIDVGCFGTRGYQMFIMLFDIIETYHELSEGVFVCQIFFFRKRNQKHLNPKL
jgi:hypothetical protein